LASKNGGPIETYAVTRFYGQMVSIPQQVYGFADLQGATQWWKDGTPSKGAALGMQAPGAALTDDMIFSAWSGASWAERMRIWNSGGVCIGGSGEYDSRLVIRGPAIGDSGGNQSWLFRESTVTSSPNVVGLLHYAHRHTAGSSNAGVQINIVHRVDSSNFGYINFNTASALGGVTLGVSGGEVLKVTADLDVYSDTFQTYSPTYTGFSPATPNQFAYVAYKKIGKWVFLWWSFYGTSNTTTMAFTLPYSAYSGSYYSLCKAMDNSNSMANPGFVLIDSNDLSKAIFWKDCSGGLFTASNYKGSQGQIVYQSNS